MDDVKLDFTLCEKYNLNNKIEDKSYCDEPIKNINFEQKFPLKNNYVKCCSNQTIIYTDDSNKNQESLKYFELSES